MGFTAQQRIGSSWIRDRFSIVIFPFLVVAFSFLLEKSLYYFLFTVKFLGCGINTVIMWKDVFAKRYTIC